MLYFTSNLITILFYFSSVSGENVKCVNCIGEKISGNNYYSWRNKREDSTVTDDISKDKMWTPTSRPSIHCKLRDGLRVSSLQCFSPRGRVACDKPLPVGTLVKFACLPFYQATYKLSYCQQDGSLSVPIKCTAVCGTSSPEAAQPLIMYGTEMSLGQWPWAAALFHRISNKWVFACGGTLVADNAVVTAAHCSWNVLSRNLLVVLGHLSLNMPNEDSINLMYHVKRVFILPVYRHDVNSYNSDIAILILKSPAKLSRNILPACLPHPDSMVTPYTIAIVAGWGKNEKRMDSTSLHYIKVPLIDTMKCLKHIPEKFIKYMSFTSFCAGYINGTGVCNGDSGNGLLTKENNKWVLQGIVSTSPRKGTSKFCHPRNYSLYTKVKIYLDWIMKVLSFEENEELKKDETT